MIYTDNMDPKSFYGRRKVPLSATNYLVVTADHTFFAANVKFTYA